MSQTSRPGGSASPAALSAIDLGAELLAEVFDRAPSMMGIVELTAEGDILHVLDNRATSAFFGLPPGGTTQRLASAMGADEATIREWTAQYRASAASGSAVQFEYAYATSEGEKWMLASVRPLAGGAEGRARFLYSAQDITRSKRAENVRREGEARVAAAHDEIRRLNVELQTRAEELQTIIDAAPVAIFMAKDEACAHLTLNRAASELLGRADGETRASPAIVREGRALAKDERPLERAARGEPSHGVEYELRFDDGRTKTIYGDAMPLRGGPGGAVRGAVAAFVDVTEPVRTRRRLATMFDANLIGNITWRLDGTITSANDAFLRALGYARSDVAERPLSWRAITPPGWEAKDEASVAVLRATGQHPPYEKEYLRKDGARVAVLVSSALFPGSDDEGISYIVDLTQVKAAERRIRELLDEATAASTAKDDFLATLAHELRNPLAPIQNAVQILAVRGAGDPQLARACDVTIRQVRHMTRLLEDLLDVSRISRDKLDLRRERIDVASTIAAAVETSRPLLDAHRHTLSVATPHAAAHVEADPVRLAQVFSNLLNNAANYTPDGGNVDVRVEAQGAVVRITVVDDGEGIAPDMLPRVFEPFTQTSRTGRGRGGLGIGLSLARKLVELHGGTIVAESAGAGKGSRFTVTLPSADAPSVAAPVASPSPIAADRRRVLVVDDNEDSADTIAELLQMLGFEVMTAYDGEQALATASTFAPAAVLLDVGMPGLSGLEVCRRLRLSPPTRASRVIAMTGWGQEQDRGRTREAGFDDHLVKPIELDDLRRLLSDPPAKRA